MSPVQPLSWKHIRLPNVPQAYHATENKLELVLGISELILLPLAQISDCIYSGNHHTCNSEWQRGVTRVALGWIKHKLCMRSAGHVFFCLFVFFLKIQASALCVIHFNKAQRCNHKSERWLQTCNHVVRNSRLTLATFAWTPSLSFYTDLGW